MRIKDINGIIVGGTYEKNRKSWEYVGENEVLRGTSHLQLQHKEYKKSWNCINNLQTFVLNYPTTIVNYSVTGDFSLPTDLGKRTTKHSTRMTIRNIIEKTSSGKATNNSRSIWKQD